MSVTQEYVKSIFIYDPLTGVVQWCQPKHGRQSCKPVGTEKRGYLVVKIDGKQYLLHRIIWLYVTGKWPDPEIDHEDTDGFNNIWTNLREADDFGNARNKNVTKLSKTGVKGVFKIAGRSKFMARLEHNKKKLNLGNYDTIEEAAKAYEAKVKELHGEFART